jgi:hypothetical protein
MKIPDAGPAPVSDLHAADWVVDELTGTTLTVGSLLPTRFDHCARILHPAQKTSEADPCQAEWVSWTEVATANGRVIDSQVQFKAIVGERFYQQGSQPGVWDQAPSLGTLPSHAADALLRVLMRHTDSESFWFGLWYGYGTRAFDIERFPRFRVPGREYVLLRGPGWGGNESFGLGPNRVTPSLWWPEDRAWFVTLDPDLDSTYVGCLSRDCIDDLLRAKDLETLEAKRTDGITWASDLINGAGLGA